MKGGNRMKGKILLGLTAILMLTGAAVPVKAMMSGNLCPAFCIEGVHRYRDGCSGAGHYG